MDPAEELTMLPQAPRRWGGPEKRVQGTDGEGNGLRFGGSANISGHIP